MRSFSALSNFLNLTPSGFRSPLFTSGSLKGSRPACCWRYDPMTWLSIGLGFSLGALVTAMGDMLRALAMAP